MPRSNAPPLTDEEIDAFIEGRIWVLKKGTDTARTAARVIKRLYEDRRRLREEIARLKAKSGLKGDERWQQRVSK